MRILEMVCGGGGFFGYLMFEIFEIFEKVEFLYDHEEQDIDNGALANLLLTAILSVTLRIQKFLSIQFWSLSDLVLEYRVRFEQ